MQGWYHDLVSKNNNISYRLIYDICICYGYNNLRCPMRAIIYARVSTEEQKP